MAETPNSPVQPPVQPYVPPSQEPQQQQQPQAPLQQPLPQPQAPPQQPVAPAQAPVAQQPLPQPEAPQQQTEPTQWQAAQQEEQFTQDQPAPPPNFAPVTWASAENTDHAKTPIWYGVLAGAVIAVTAAIYILTQETLASLAILVVGGSAAFFASHSPASRNYEITSDHVKINHKAHSIDNFKSFSLVSEGPKNSIWLKPVKRFAPFQFLYYPPEQEENIINALSLLLPHEERELDNLDRLTKTLKF